MKTGFLIDLFGTVCNCHWDLARIISALTWLGVNLLAIYRASQGEIPTLSDYASANLQVLTGCAIFIGGKDLARSIATKGATAP
jgi:hypothetical protein